MWNFITSIAFYFAIFYKKKIIFSPHGTMDKNNIKKNFFLKKIFYYLIEKNNIKYIDLVHFLSPDEKKNSKYLSDNKYFIANNGLDLNRFKINKQKKLKIFKNNKFNILNMGRYNKIKGLEIQLQLIKKINKLKDEFRIFFVGPNCKEKKKLIKISPFIYKKTPFFKNIRLVSTHSKVFTIKLPTLRVVQKSLGQAIMVLETSKGLLTHTEALKLNVSGRILCVIL